MVNHILAHMKEEAAPAEFGLIGLGVMGKSLALNLAENGVRLALYNRHVPGKEEDVARRVATENAEVGHLVGFDDLPAFVGALARPRKIMLMVTAGAAVDAQIADLLPLLDPGDVLIDGGNSHYRDTMRRARLLAEHDAYFVGAGVSGGEEGARRGPAIMAGCALVAPFFERIAARDQYGAPCTAYLGPDGAGHFVKMVHNGIEYAEMQLLAEAYQMLRHLQAPPAEMTEILRGWQAHGELNSYLLGITIDILQVREGEGLLLDQVLDQAEQKGTGGWSVQAALEFGVPFGIITEAVLARVLSAHQPARVQGAGRFPAPALPELAPAERRMLIGQLQNGYQAARLLNHASGFQLLQAASREQGWDLNLSEIARIWTGGCIIRSGLMEQLSQLLRTHEDLLAAPALVERLRAYRADFAAVVAAGLLRGVALPVLSAALNYFLGYTTARSPANLIQAQRDYFGAHTFRRTDRPAGEAFHADWQAPLAP
ncbi:MAG: NADP-dependent phosphogluconate dehydrogenase [Hymenobacter sp.]